MIHNRILKVKVSRAQPILVDWFRAPRSATIYVSYEWFYSLTKITDFHVITFWDCQHCGTQNVNIICTFIIMYYYLMKYFSVGIFGHKMLRPINETHHGKPILFAISSILQTILISVHEPELPILGKI